MSTLEPKIAVLGLRDFSRKLRQVDGEAVKQLRIVFNEAAGLVVADARPKIPRRSGRAAGSLKMRSSRTAVRIAMGGKRAPYLPWLDFGGRVGRNRSVARPFLRDGRYLYKSFRDRRPDVQDAMESGVRRIARAAGLEVD
ncbi:hypothetical protein [Salinispora vitiensis]|uniref:hypothetical protein n=1 Tax=Salinispora vitiensis TaxID=999544 RepID=UPI0003800CC4|nr:hypothetical protein [Salinispora vitiensis]